MIDSRTMVAFSDELQKLATGPAPTSMQLLGKGLKAAGGVAKKGLKYTAIGAGGVGAAGLGGAYLMTRPDPNTVY